MAHWLTYIPGESIEEPIVLEAAGCGGVWREGDSRPQFAHLKNDGPDGDAGMLVLPFHSTDTEHDPVLAYHSDDRQVWHCHPGEKHWIGWETNRPPTPEDLARTEMIPGAALPLGDGNRWVLPNYSLLVHRIAIGKDGQPEKRSEYENAELHQSSLEMLAMLEASLGGDLDGGAWDFKAAFAFVCEALQRNYRLTPFLVGELGLLTEEILFTAASFVCDWDRIQALQAELQKKTLETEN
jgi:hypothetical protein